MKLIAHLTFVLAVGLPAFAAKTHVVNNANGNPGCPGTFKTIQAAINASAAGDTVYVCASGVPYNEQLIISTSITLAGQTGATVQPTALATEFNDTNGVPTAPFVFVSPLTGSTTVSVTISNLIFDGINNTVANGCATGIAGIVYLDASGTIVHNTVKNVQLYPFAGLGGLGGCQTGFAIYAESTGANANGQTVAITQNSLHDYQKGGVVAFGTGMQAPVQYNTIQGIGATGITAQNGIEVDDGTGAIQGNTVLAHAYTGGVYAACDILTFPDGLTFSSNTVSQTDVGIYSIGNGATISNNIVYNTTALGGGIIFADGSATSNTVTNSAYAAFEYYGTSNASLTKNTIIDANIGISNDNNNNLNTNGTKYFATLTPVFVPPPVPPPAKVGTRLHVSPFVKR